MEVNRLKKYFLMLRDSEISTWWGAIYRAGIPTPSINPVPLPARAVEVLENKDLWTTLMKDVEFALIPIREYPLFMRTEHYASKHQFKYTCFIEKREVLPRNIRNLLRRNLEEGFEPKAIIFREYIQPAHVAFKAFSGNLPIALEWRVLANRDGPFMDVPMWSWTDFVKKPPRPEEVEELTTHLASLPPEELKETLAEFEPIKSLPGTWFERLMKMNSMFSEKDRELIYQYAHKVVRINKFSWVIDFMKGADGKWYLIDIQRLELGTAVPYWLKPRLEEMGYTFYDDVRASVAKSLVE